jgi:putative aminopeptidase FrvX
LLRELTDLSGVSGDERYSHSPVELVNMNDAARAVEVLKEVMAANGSVPLDFI